MLFVVVFENDPARLDVRQSSMAAHLEFLRRHTREIRVAGPLRTTPEAAPQGGMWIVDVPDKNAVEALIAADPFTTAGLRASHRVLHYSKAFTEQQLI